MVIRNEENGELLVKYNEDWLPSKIFLLPGRPWHFARNEKNNRLFW